MNELNNWLLSHPFQTGMLPEGKLKSAFINICTPKWQQEFLKMDVNVNKRSSTWEEIVPKAKPWKLLQMPSLNKNQQKENSKKVKLHRQPNPLQAKRPRKCLKNHKVSSVVRHTFPAVTAHHGMPIAGREITHPKSAWTVDFCNRMRCEPFNPTLSNPNKLNVSSDSRNQVSNNKKVDSRCCC